MRRAKLLQETAQIRTQLRGWLKVFRGATEIVEGCIGKLDEIDAIANRAPRRKRKAKR